MFKDFTRVTATTDAFYGLIKQCKTLEDIVRAQAEDAGKDIVLPVTPALNAVRQTISDPPWLDQTCGHQNGPVHTSNQ